MRRKIINKHKSLIKAKNNISDNIKQPFFKKKTTIYAIVIAVITLICYSSSINNDFTKNWDDGGYIIHNKPIHKISSENIKTIFTIFYKGNYHPLTSLTYAVEYALVGESPALYHIDNLIIHLLNVLLVFWLIYLLSKRIEVAAIAALFFGIHPMHVESVAWISERKDVLYSFFFLSSIISYLYYLKISKKSGCKINFKNKYYILSLLLFILSLLSKSAAVVLPVVLILTDYYVLPKYLNTKKYDATGKRKIIYKTLIEKIPFFAFSFLFGILAILSQGSSNAIQDLTLIFSIPERLLIVCYSLMIYIYKLFAPINLSAMYAYPNRINRVLPTIYYIAPFFILLFTFLIYKSKKFNKDIIFGFLFFLITIILVLQLLPVGGAIMAERYVYIPYIGFFFIIGKTYTYVSDSKKKSISRFKNIFLVIIIAFSVMFFYLSKQRIKVWKNGEVLFTDIINKYPNLPFAYNNRGYYYYNYAKDYDKALKDYNKSISLDNSSHRAYSNRGVLYYNIGKYNLALKDFNKCLGLNKSNTDALIGRANTYSSLKKNKLALSDYNKYLIYKPEDTQAYIYRGISKYNMEKSDDAMIDFNKSLSIMPDNDEAYYWIGLNYFKKKDFKYAIKNLDKSLKLNSNRIGIYSWRGLAKYNLKLYKESISDYNMAIKNNPNDAASYVNRSVAYFKIKNYDKAFQDICAAGDLRYALDKAYFMKVKKMAGK